MPRLCALLLLAGLAVSAGRRRPVNKPYRKENATPVSRILSPAECRLLVMPSPSKARH